MLSFETIKNNSNAIARNVIEEDDESDAVNDIMQIFAKENVNLDALKAIDRIRDKLSGCDFPNKDKLSVKEQVDLLIKEATSSYNLCQA